MEVSVIVPTRNRSALLATTLRSVLRQRDVNLEVIVVDDASTDDTPDMLAALADSRVRVIRQDRPSGVAAARNRAAADTHGEWLAFVDDDDLWAPEKLACQLQVARELGRDWAYTGAVVINMQGRVVRVQRPLPPEELVTALLSYHAIPGGGSNVVIRRAAWQRTGPFDTRFPPAEDWELYIRLAKHSLPACVCSPLVARRLHHSNATLDVSEMVRVTHLIEALHHLTVDWGTLHRWFAHSYLRAGRRWAALGQFAHAAVHGQLRGVASDLTAVFQDRVGRRRPTSSDPGRDDVWIGMAATWIQELQPSGHAIS